MCVCVCVCVCMRMSGAGQMKPMVTGSDLCFESLADVALQTKLTDITLNQRSQTPVMKQARFIYVKFKTRQNQPIPSEVRKWLLSEVGLWEGSWGMVRLCSSGAVARACALGENSSPNARMHVHSSLAC